MKDYGRVYFFVEENFNQPLTKTLFAELTELKVSGGR
jgi:uncharacterized protein YukJ